MQLRASGDLDGEPTPTQRMANFYEKGDKPLEIVATRQWYITNGGRDAEVRAEMLARGAEITWLPRHMKHRYDNWVGGLNGDWLISRQRFFGIPFPVWYTLDAEGEPDYDHPLLPREEELPIDPSTQAPSGYTEDQRGKAGGFLGDPDVMDTWATSSLTPQIAGGWEEDEDLFERVFPMDLCTHAHDIIRTWLFSRVVRAHFENHAVPWSHALISGFIVDPDRKKMSKSKGNVVVPDRGPRQVRRRRGPLAGGDGPAGPGLALRRDPDEGRPPAGDEGPERLEVRARQRPGPRVDPPLVTEPVDRALLGKLARASRGHARLRAYDYTTALEVDREVLLGLLRRLRRAGQGEGLRRRGASAGDRSAKAALATALHVQLRMFAPFLPYATEEVWSWWQQGSIHLQAWPTADDLGDAASADPAVLDAVEAVLAGVRGAKSTAKVGMRTPVERATITGPASALEAIRSAGATCVPWARSPASWSWSQPRTARSGWTPFSGSLPPSVDQWPWPPELPRRSPPSRSRSPP